MNTVISFTSFNAFFSLTKCNVRSKSNCYYQLFKFLQMENNEFYKRFLSYFCRILIYSCNWIRCLENIIPCSICCVFHMFNWFISRSNSSTVVVNILRNSVFSLKEIKVEKYALRYALNHCTNISLIFVKDSSEGSFSESFYIPHLLSLRYYFSHHT